MATNKDKYRSVVYLKEFSNGRVGILPFAVTSASGRTFRGRHCSNCVVMEKPSWEKEGLNLVIELLLTAPVEASNTFIKWGGVPTESIFKIESKNAHMTNYDISKAVKVETWVDRRDHENPKIAKVSIYPSWNPYLSGEVFNFTKTPTSEKFLSEIRRLFDESTKAKW